MRLLIGNKYKWSIQIIAALELENIVITLICKRSIDTPFKSFCNETNSNHASDLGCQCCLQSQTSR